MSATERKVLLAPSILAADFARLGQQVEEATRAGADLIHVDVMDGHFVPNITIGPVVVSAIRPYTTLPLDVHLMIEDPDRYLRDFAEAGADRLVVHAEACRHLHRTLCAVRDLGLKAGVAVNPATPLSAVEEVLHLADVVLVCSVDPGFAGQRFIPGAVRRIERLRAMLTERGLSCAVEVDGGVNQETAPLVVRAGADILVAGTAVFNPREPVEMAIRRLRHAVASALAPDSTEV